jgi:branched-chain amino acid transport system permease protein
VTDLLNALVTLLNFVVVPAAAYGAQLALGALGVTLIYGILRFSNFAHGDTMAFGTAVTILLTFALQAAGITGGFLPTALIALPVGIAATALLVLGTDRVVYRFYRQQRAAPSIFVIVSLGVTFVMNGIVRFLVGVEDIGFTDGERFVVTARGFREATGLDEGLAIRTTQVITLAVAAVCVAALFWFLNRTRTGKSMRAFSDNEDLGAPEWDQPRAGRGHHLDRRRGPGHHGGRALRASTSRSRPSRTSSSSCPSSRRPS